MSVSLVGQSHKLGRYPSELNWSSLGDVLGFIYDTGMRTDQAMLRVTANGKEEQGEGLPAMNSKRGAYHDKDSPTQPPGCRV